MTQFKARELANAILLEAETESTNFTERDPNPDPEETDLKFQENLICVTRHSESELAMNFKAS